MGIVNGLPHYSDTAAHTVYGEVMSDDSIDFLLFKFGSKSNSLILKQPDIKFWGNCQGVVGFVTIQTLLGKRQIVFTNPLCALDHYKPLLAAFLAVYPNTVFVSVDASVCEVLNGLGYKTNHFGWENLIELNGFTTQGTQKKYLRKVRNHWTKAGAVVREQAWEEVDAGAVLDISRRWRQSKEITGRELTLFTRPPIFDEESGVRKFYCYHDEKLVGYVFFLPIYKDHQVMGYGSNITRFIPSAGYSGITDFILLTAIDQFKSEGLEVLSLGISPLFALEPMENERRLVRRLLALSFRYMNRLYAFKGLCSHKKKYRAQGEKWFLCTKQSMGVLQLAYCLGVGSRVFGCSPSRGAQCD
jgi:lysylphosphatidylglycerol synthetase-like protein (DUF2156 family)